jgi:hypothetical protein
MSMIYLIECKRDYETVYKIGFSKNSPSKRSEGLQTGNDGELKILHRFQSVHGQKVERTMQRSFSHKKINKGGKEWFRLDLEDVQNFNTMCQKVENNLTHLEYSQNRI